MRSSVPREPLGEQVRGTRQRSPSRGARVCAREVAPPRSLSHIRAGCANAMTAGLPVLHAALQAKRYLLRLAGGDMYGEERQQPASLCPPPEKRHQPSADEQEEDGERHFAVGRFGHCSETGVSHLRSQPGGRERERHALVDEKTKSCARHSTRPAHKRMPADVASRTPLTMLAAAESGLYLCENKAGLARVHRSKSLPGRTSYGCRGRQQYRAESCTRRRAQRRWGLHARESRSAVGAAQGAERGGRTHPSCTFAAGARRTTDCRDRRPRTSGER